MFGVVEVGDRQIVFCICDRVIQYQYAAATKIVIAPDCVVLLTKYLL